MVRRSALRFAIVGFVCLAAATARAAEMRVGSAKGEIVAPAPKVMKPKPGEAPTIEVDGVRFHARFGKAGDIGGSPRFSTGGVFANGGARTVSVRVCVAFLDADDNIVYAETLDQSELGSKAENTACPLRAIPAGMQDKVARYQLTMQVSDARILN